VTAWRRWLQPVCGAAILVVIVARLGTGPFVDAFRATDIPAMVGAIAMVAVTTTCCAWRWRRIAAALGVDLPIRAAVAAYYRSQFLNGTLPGGVLGDVHRVLRHGRETGELRRSATAVVAERTAGQMVQAAAAIAVLLIAPYPVGSVVTAAVVTVALLRWPVVVSTSLVSTAGHAAVFLVAARSVGSDASSIELLGLGLVVLLAAAIPLNIAGWGPREGAAAWAFSAAGLGAAEGATIAVTYGVLSLVAILPGAVLLAVDWYSRSLTTDRLTGAARG
jgi:uncharacterized membrane protein YbhN (UPF0104 family)